MNHHLMIFFGLALLAVPLDLKAEAGGLAVSDYNVKWTDFAKDSQDSMTTGNGDIGQNVWTEANGHVPFAPFPAKRELTLLMQSGANEQRGSAEPL